MNMFDDFQKAIVGLSVYDYYSAQIAADAGVDFLLVGDSLGMVVLGMNDTGLVKLDDLLRHGEAVMRGAGSVPIIIDLPAESCVNAEKALADCDRIECTLGIRNIKLEGKVDIAEILVEKNFNVMGHTGLKPQSAAIMKVVGRNSEADEVLREALELEKAGVFSIILECVPENLGKIIAQNLKIPVIGIGAGIYTDGQILVISDLVGLTVGKKPKFVRRYGNVHEIMAESVRKYCRDVREGYFPGKSESYY